MPPSPPKTVRLTITLDPWWWARILTVTAMIALAAACWLRPEIGLPVLWGLVVPALPLVWAVAPQVWRNVCPMAAVNQIPRGLGISGSRRLPGWLERSGFGIGATTFVVVVALRPSALESDGRGAAVMLIAALVMAWTGGRWFAGKSGFCGSICPLRPVQTLYARSPVVRADHAHCRPCVGCTPNCQDVLPERSLLAELATPGPRGESRWVFAGFLPGFSLAFVTTPDGTAPLPALAALLLGGLVSLGALTIADAIRPAERARLTAFWSAIALMTLVLGNLPATADAVNALTGVQVDGVALWEARAVGAVLVATWLLRSLRLVQGDELGPAALTTPTTTATAPPAQTLLPMALVEPTPGRSAAPAAQPVAPTGVSSAPAPLRPTVTFWPNGLTVDVPEATPTIAAAARAAGLELPEGCGTGLCGCDPVYILNGRRGLQAPSAQEQATLKRLGLPAHARLACSTVVTDSLTVSLEPVAALPDGAPHEQPDHSTGPATPAVGPAPLVGAPAIAASHHASAIWTVGPHLAPVPSPAGAGTTHPPRILIVGNGIAGVTAAEQLRRFDADCEIELISRSPNPFYNRIAIARLIHQPRGLGSLQLMPERWYAERRITQWLNTTVAGIDRGARELALGTGQVLSYDKLILATGAGWAHPQVPGSDLPGVFGVREAVDAMQLRAYAQRRHASRATVIGGGLLGLEVAEALLKLGLQVTVLERGEGLSRHVLDARASSLVQQSIERAGATVRTEASVAAIEGDERVRGVRLQGGEVQPADLVVCCVGIRPRAELAAEAGLTVDRGVVVDDAMRTSDANILACGDVAQVGGQIAGHWAVGAAQAEVAAATALGRERQYRAAPVPTVLKLDGLEVVSVGHLRWRDGIRVVESPRTEHDRHVVVHYAGTQPIGLVAVNGGPEIDPVIDAIVHRNEAAGAIVDPGVARAAVAPLPPEVPVSVPVRWAS